MFNRAQRAAMRVNRCAQFRDTQARQCIGRYHRRCPGIPQSRIPQHVANILHAPFGTRLIGLVDDETMTNFHDVRFDGLHRVARVRRID